MASKIIEGQLDIFYFRSLSLFTSRRPVRSCLSRTNIWRLVKRRHTRNTHDPVRQTQASAHTSLPRPHSFPFSSYTSPRSHSRLHFIHLFFFFFCDTDTHFRCATVRLGMCMVRKNYSLFIPSLSSTESREYLE